jgi:hypothetical protein
LEGGEDCIIRRLILCTLYPKEDQFKSVKWRNHVVRMEEMRIIFQSENPKGRNHSENLSVRESVILKWVLRNRM